MSLAEKTVPRDAAAHENGLAAIPGLAFWTDGNQQAVESWLRSNAAMLKGTLELAQELVSFSQMRLAADVETWRELAGCRNPGEFFACQKHFAERAATEYMEEANKLAGRMSSLMSGATLPFQEAKAAAQPKA